MGNCHHGNVNLEESNTNSSNLSNSYSIDNLSDNTENDKHISSTISTSIGGSDSPKSSPFRRFFSSSSNSSSSCSNRKVEFYGNRRDQRVAKSLMETRRKLSESKHNNSKRQISISARDINIRTTSYYV